MMETTICTQYHVGRRNVCGRFKRRSFVSATNLKMELMWTFDVYHVTRNNRIKHVNVALFYMLNSYQDWCCKTLCITHHTDYRHSHQASNYHQMTGEEGNEQVKTLPGKGVANTHDCNVFCIFVRACCKHFVCVCGCVRVSCVG